MKRKPRRDEGKKLADDARLGKQWNAWHREQLDEALAGEHGPLVAEIMSALGKLDINNAGAMVTAVTQVDWARVDVQTRLVVLHEINGSISRLRERSGLTTFDDPLPHQPDRAFQHVKRALFPN
jgi:hypothetical protein